MYIYTERDINHRTISPTSGTSRHRVLPGFVETQAWPGGHEARLVSMNVGATIAHPSVTWGVVPECDAPYGHPVCTWFGHQSFGTHTLKISTFWWYPGTLAKKINHFFVCTRWFFAGEKGFRCCCLIEKKIKIKWTRSWETLGLISDNSYKGLSGMNFQCSNKIKWNRKLMW